MVKNYIKINRISFLKARVFALILLILSCSLVLSGYRSLGREFNGTLFKKEKTDSFYSSDYTLYLIPITKINKSEEIITLLASQKQILHKVGVSSLVYEAANELVKVEKKGFSVFIMVGNDRFFDKGIFWLIWSIMGIVCSFLMYGQTVKPVNPTITYDNEEIDIPGLN